MRDVVVEDVTPSVELVPRDATHHASALELVLERRFLVSQLCETGEFHKYRQDGEEKGCFRKCILHAILCEYLSQD